MIKKNGERPFNHSDHLLKIGLGLGKKNWEKLRLILWVSEKFGSISETQVQETATRKFDNQRKLLQENQTYYSTSETTDDLFEKSFSNFNRLNEYAKMPKSCCLLLFCTCHLRSATECGFVSWFPEIYLYYNIIENWEDKYIECAIENPNLSYCFKFLIVFLSFSLFFLRLVINN